MKDRLSKYLPWVILTVVPLLWIFGIISGEVFSSFLFAVLFGVCVYFVKQNRELMREVERYKELMHEEGKDNGSRGSVEG